MKRICIQWPRLGPYHLARLTATHEYLGRRGIELVALETASSDATYAWRVESGATSFPREQVFPGQVFDDLRPSRIHRAVMQALDRIDPDAVVINSYSMPDARACLYWCRRNCRTAVVVSDSKEDDAPRSAWREAIKARLVGQFDAALVGGTPHRAYFRKLGFPDARIFLGCDVVDNDFFAAGAAAARAEPQRFRPLPGLESDEPFLLSVNRFIPIKNLSFLLDAYARYRRQAAHPWRLVLVGDGPLRAELERYIERERLSGVTLAGFRQTEDLAAYYGLAGALVHPTLKDTWGLIVNEAMAAGLPVLVSERAGCAMDLVIDGENGFRFDPEDADALSALMGRIASAPQRAQEMGARSRQIISAWSLERFAEGVWQAAVAGSRSADRPFDPLVRAFLLTMQLATPGVSTFHSVRDEI